MIILKKKKNDKKKRKKRNNIRFELEVSKILKEGNIGKIVVQFLVICLIIFFFFLLLDKLTHS